MRNRWKGPWSLVLLGLTAGARADESAWQPARSAFPSAPAPAASLGRPVPLAAGGAQPCSSCSMPAVTLARPVPLDEGRPDGAAMRDSAIRLVSHGDSPLVGMPRTVRAQGPDLAQPLPSPRVLEPGTNKPETLDTGTVPAPGHDPKPGELPLAEHGPECAGCQECGPCACPTCGNGPAERFYASADYLFWGLKGYRVPPLLTTGPALGPGMEGILTRGGVLVFGDRELGNDGYSGARFTAGYWFDDCQQLGIEGTFFFLGQQSRNYAFGSGQFGGVLDRSFFAPNTLPAAGLPGEFAETIGSPGFSTGAAVISSTTKLWGAEVNLRKNLLCDCAYRLDLLGGFRYLNLFDNLMIGEVIDVSPTETIDPLVAGQHTVAADNFSTRNQFYGGQIGASFEYRWGSWSLGLRGMVALGSTNEVVNVVGGSNVSRNGAALAVDHPGDLFALSSNIGHYSRNEFSVVPEVGLNLGYQITDHIRARVGYSFLYWSNVLRPGDQIDRTVDLSLVPSTFPRGIPAVAGVSPARPLPPPLRSTDFWAQGFNAGLEFEW